MPAILLLAIYALRAASTDPSLHGRWLDESFDVLRLAMHRMEKKLPFAWVRYGDGEMITAAQNSPYGDRLGDSLLFLASHNDAVVNLGTWWLKNSHLASLWNQVVPEKGDFLFHDFFLPAHWGSCRKRDQNMATSGDRGLEQNKKPGRLQSYFGRAWAFTGTSFCGRNSLH